MERMQQLEADKAALEEKVAALQAGQGEAVQRLSAQLTAGESERAELQKAAAETIENIPMISYMTSICSL